MLVLSRRAGEGLVVGNSIRIKILEISSSVVRIGFEAPADVSIYRDELYAEIAEATRAAMSDGRESDSNDSSEGDP